MDEVVSDLGIRIVRTFSLKEVAEPFAKVGVFVYKVRYFISAVFTEHFLSASHVEVNRTGKFFYPLGAFILAG